MIKRFKNRNLKIIVLFVTGCVFTTSALAQNIATYDIPIEDIFIVDPTGNGTLTSPSTICNDTGNEIQYSGTGFAPTNNNPDNGLSFRWNSRGSGTINSILFEFYYEYLDVMAGGPNVIILNGNPIGPPGPPSSLYTYIGTAADDLICNNDPSIWTWTAPVAHYDDYLAGGMNTINIQSTPILEWVLTQNPSWNNGYIRVTTDYSGPVTDPAPLIPTMGQWALIILGLLLSSFGIIYVWRLEKKGFEHVV